MPCHSSPGTLLNRPELCRRDTRDEEDDDDDDGAEGFKRILTVCVKGDSILS